MNAIVPSAALAGVMSARDTLARDAAEAPIYAAAAKLARCVSLYNALRGAIAGTLPVAEAEALMDDIEDQLDVIGVKLKRALAVFDAEIGRIEAAS